MTLTGPAEHVLGELQVASPDLDGVEDVDVGVVDLLPRLQSPGCHHPHAELQLPGPAHHADAPGREIV